MNAILDHGHEYELLTLDLPLTGEYSQTLRFVKREDAHDDLKFPGNKGHHAGTTVQSVLRVLHSRMAFLDSQHHCAENVKIMELLRESNYLLEVRAARRHGRNYTLTIDEAIDAPMCPECGHTKCEHKTEVAF